VGSKSDKVAARKVKYEEGEALAAQHGSKFCEVSAKTRENVRKPFIEIVDQIVQTPELLQSSGRRAAGTVAVGSSDGILGSGCSC